MSESVKKMRVLWAASANSNLIKMSDSSDQWAYDHMCLQLNYDWCFNQGRHPNTCVHDWALFKFAIKLVIDVGFNEPMYRLLEARLMERDGFVKQED